MWLCDQCGAQVVRSGLGRPLVSIWGANQIPFRRGNCQACEKTESISNHPDVNPVQVREMLEAIAKNE